ncbi:MAG: transketolase family protein [Candidatus Uhrbacteria bacterium]
MAKNNDTGTETKGQKKSLATRDGFGQGLVEAGKKNKQVVVLSADLTESTRCLPFKKQFPERFIQLGVSEQSMASIAAGMSLVGKIPFITSYAVFSPGRNWEQVRTCIALQNSNVKIVGSHAGLNVGPDGASHQGLEDIALTRVLPNMTVVVPCDAEEARKATLAAAELVGPVYLRLTRESSPAITVTNSPFKIGRAETLRPGKDATIIAAGPIVFEAIEAAKILKQKNNLNVRVINCHTIKPLDQKTILTAAKQTGAIVTAEEHMMAGGLGSAVAELLVATYPVPMEFVGVKDKFGESGKPMELMKKYGLLAENIVKAVLRAIKRKNNNCK